MPTAHNSANFGDFGKTCLMPGDPLRAKELDLDRRIRILYQEQNELTEIIAHLTSYRRRLEERAEA